MESRRTSTSNAPLLLRAEGVAFGEVRGQPVQLTVSQGAVHGRSG